MTGSAPERTPTATASTDIAASPERVYEIVSDPAKLAEVAGEYYGHRWLDGATGPVLGARFTGRNRNGLARWSTVARITDAEPGRRFGFHVTVAGFPGAHWQYEIAPTEHGCTVTESTWRLAPKAAAKIANLALGIGDRDRHNQRNIEQTLANLKARLERG